jgi:cysteine synthase
MANSDLLRLIGNTPLIELEHLSPKPGVSIFAKLEGQNPGGSIKDRVVNGIIEQAEKRGDLIPGDTIVEASSGNTAISLAMIGKQKGYKVKLFLPGGVVPSIVDLLNLYQADVEWCESRAGLKSAIEKSQEVAREKGFYSLSQFFDEVNLTTHYSKTGKEIVDSLPEIDVLVAGIGTGGTIMGVGRKIREVNPNVKIVGVEPQIGERLQGLCDFSEGFIPPLLDLKQLDRRFLVDNFSALQATRKVAFLEGILPGVSSGAALVAAFRVAKQMASGNIVVIFPDNGWK